MKQPSREIIENAREAAKHDPDNKSYNPCSGFTCQECAFVFLNLTCSQNTVDQDIQFFQDFLAKYDTEEKMFKVGDKVKLKYSLKATHTYNGVTLFDRMAKLKGMILTIDSVNHYISSTSFTFEEDSNKYEFIAEMLERVDTMNTEKEIEALKARIAKLEGKKDTYPCIKKCDNTVVLFTSPSYGVVLSSSLWPDGDYSKSWDESQFTETLTEYTVKV